ncbi:MAG TPA: peptidylprolyl isomerase [Acidimicrobiales bacterium]|jgi:hypothetical protein|nr:peptidylprolyl isomerase [Acidimicrobiales bacterium]
MVMTSPKTSLAAVLVAALALSACSSLTEARAASVNGDVISAADLEDELLAIRGNDAYRDAVERTLSQQGLGVTGAGQGSFDTAFVARLLSLRVFFALVGQEARARGIEVGPADIEDARPATVASVGGEEVFDAFPEDYREELVARQALALQVQEAIAAPPGEEEARAFYEENPEQFAAVCVSHIFVSTGNRSPEEAQARIDDLARQLAEGADFTTLASEQSDDAQAASQEGSLGCQTPGSFLASFEAAAFALPVGEVSPPVQTEIGYHLIRVDDRQEAPFEQVETQVLEALEQRRVETFATFVNDVTCEAEVDVNPRYGSWTGACEDPEQEGRVVPPEGPAEAEPTLDPAVPGGGALRPGG